MINPGKDSNGILGPQVDEDDAGECLQPEITKKLFCVVMPPQRAERLIWSQ